MRDGRTECVIVDDDSGPEWRATLVEVAGGAEGNEYPLDRDRVVIGRGPGVDLAFHDDKMSAQHALFERTRGVLCVTDLDSTNGLRVNGERVATRALSHGDRVELGGHAFELLLEKRERPPRTWVVE